MKARTSLAATSMIPVVGLLVLAGVFSIARPALASCPLPPGATAPDDPTVTAEQVEDGSATVEEFALAGERAVQRVRRGGRDRRARGIYRMHHKGG